MRSQKKGIFKFDLYFRLKEGLANPYKFANRGVAIPGYNPGYLKTVISLPENAESIVLELEDRGYGILRNHGLGPALECEVCWIAEEVVIAGSKFKVTEDKLKEPLYCEELNTWACSYSKHPLRRVC